LSEKPEPGVRSQESRKDKAVPTPDSRLPTPSLLCAALEIALNRYLRLEPAALEECARLAGRSVELQVLQPAWSFFIEFAAGGVRVASEPPQSADVSVSGPLTHLLRLGIRAAQGESGVPAGLQVEGDTELLTRFNKLLAGVGFDLEEVLARYLDGGAAHRMAQGIQGLLGWGRKTAGTLSLDTAEYLREETRDLARREDVEEWMDAVEQLREGVDRFEARLARLEESA
jgi:ubiquinone biosynthesis protein UbiJ